MFSCRKTSVQLKRLFAVTLTFLLLGIVSITYGYGEPSVALTQQREAQELAQLWDADAARRSQELYMNAADEWARQRKPTEAVECLIGAARQSTALGQKGDALSLLHRAEHLAGGTDDPNLLSILFAELSLTSFELGEVRKAESYIRSSLASAEKASQEDSRAFAFYAAGEISYFRNDSRKATEHYRHALEINQRIGDQRSLARTLISIGWVDFGMLNFDQALANFEHACTAAGSAGDRKGQAMALKGIGTVHNAVNNKQSALKFYFSALDLFPDGLDASEKATIHNGIASVFEHFGNQEGAIASRETALALFEQDSYVFGQYVTLGSLGLHYLAVGNLDKAENALNRSLAMAAKGEDRSQLGITLQGIAKLHQRKGNHAGAIAALQDSLKYLHAPIDRRPRSVSYVLLGRVFLDAGQVMEATTAFENASKLNAIVKDRFLDAEILYQLGNAELKSGNHAAAEMYFKESVRLTETLSSDSANAQLRRSLISSEFERYHSYIALLMTSSKTDHDSNLLALKTLEKGRARAILETLVLANANVAADADPELLAKESALRNRLGHASDRLVDLESMDSKSEETERLQSEVNSLVAQLEELRAELKQSSPVYTAIKNPPDFDLAEFQGSVLDDDSILLEYFLGDEQSYLWMVGRSEFEVFDLPARKVIEDHVDKLRNLLESRKRTQGESIDAARRRVVEADSSYTTVARDLSDILLGPVSERIRGKRIIIVPDGKLNNLAISSLPRPLTSSDDPILLTNEVVYQPSAQTLSLLKKFRAGTDELRTRDLLVFSDPVFSRADSRLAGSQPGRPTSESAALNLRFAESLESLHRLPASGQEAKSIAGIVGPGRTDTFTGFDATRERLLSSRLEEYRIIHLATHALLDQERPELSAVIFSGFDENGQKIDQAVRLQDIYAMKLNADLVVLSACQTAAGKEIKGEGVMGLNSAFLQAGAHSVVASLWQVDDNATNLLMKEFYRGMANGLSVSAALREAQLALYRDPQFRSPFFWAAFTLQGDMNRRPDIGSGSYAWWFVGLSAMFVVAGIVLWKKFGRRLATRR